MKKLNILILSILMLYSFTAHAVETRGSKDLSIRSAEKSAGCYKVSKSYPLSKSIHGIDGILQLLQDSRLTKDLYNKQFGTAFNDRYMYDKKMRPLFKDNPPLAAILRVLMQDKGFVSTRESHTFDNTPIAWLEEVRLLGADKPSYLLTKDESIGMGSYNGPVTYFYEIVDGKLKPIEYINNETKKKDKIVLMRSLKTNWKLVKSKNGNSKDILHVACRPNYEGKSEGEAEFLTNYDRFHFDGEEWVRYERADKDFWEVDEDDFPPLSKFPISP
jgi:hypothetical protein